MQNKTCSCFDAIDVKVYNSELQFQPITIADKELIESYTKPWEAECSDLSFANLFIWGGDGNMQYAEKNNFLYIRLTFDGVPPYFWAPIPKKDTQYTYRCALFTAVGHMEKLGVEPTFRSVCEPFASMIREACPELIGIPTDIAWDYVYTQESLATLKGKKLHGKRNHINKFNTLYPEYEYKKIDSSMIDDCIRLYDQWIEEKDGEVDQGLIEERESVLLALNHMDELNLVGGAIYIENRLVAFTIGERLTDDMQLVHIEKADYMIEGIFPMINQQYVLHECGDVEWINREEDMGLEGMRKAKHSYNPARMVEKFMFGLRDLTDVEGLWGDRE